MPNNVVISRGGKIHPNELSLGHLDNYLDILGHLGVQYKLSMGPVGF